MKATFYIRGIGMIYHKDDGLWKVLFPFDECHTVKFKTSEQDEGISLASAGGGIRIRANSPTSVFKVGDRFDDFLDITSEVSHKDGIKMIEGQEMKSVLLTIENAEFSVGGHTFCRYQLLNETHVMTHPKEIAYSGKVVIEGEEVVIEAEGVEDFPKTFNQDVRFIIDNTCIDEENDSVAEPVSDFELLYQIIEDAADSKKKFKVDRDPAQKPGAIITDLSFSGVRRLDNVLPGQKGLPCNVVKVSKPDNLQ